MIFIFTVNGLKQYEVSKHIGLDSKPSRDKIKVGTRVYIIQKQDQRSGELTEGIVKRILTSSVDHPHGIKVELEGGKIGRVQRIA